MLYQIIEAGWVYEIETPGPCRIARDGDGRAVLLVPGESEDETLEPHAVVRAAKDRLLGLSCSRSWRIDPAATPLDPALVIREIRLSA